MGKWGSHPVAVVGDAPEHVVDEGLVDVGRDDLHPTADLRERRGGFGEGLGRVWGGSCRCRMHPVVDLGGRRGRCRVASRRRRDGAASTVTRTQKPANCTNPSPAAPTNSRTGPPAPLSLPAPTTSFLVLETLSTRSPGRDRMGRGGGRELSAEILAQTHRRQVREMPSPQREQPSPHRPA